MYKKLINPTENQVTELMKQGYELHSITPYKEKARIFELYNCVEEEYKNSFLYSFIKTSIDFRDFSVDLDKAIKFDEEKRRPNNISFN